MAVNVDNMPAGAVPNDNGATVVVDQDTDLPDSSQYKELTKMTDWYDPRQLLDTAKKTLISTIIGENADPRLVGELPGKGTFFDYSQEFVNDQSPASATDRQEIWIDYVSDVGDGFNSTYSVAYSLASEALEVAGKVLPRGELLIFGGDGVYPTATSAEYEQKLVKPYRLAVNAHRTGIVDKNETNLKKLPHVFVLPGNHDWYDSLVAFQKIFCTSVFNNRSFAGGWKTRQKRSYFALKLPRDWWLLGIDLQLSHNMDVPQLQYFESIVAEMKAGDKVILCVPEPYWVKAIKYQDHEEAFKKLIEKEESIKTLEDMLRRKGVQRKLYVAGDLHHYRRFESNDADRVQKITAGGGGAFLHPTHDFDYVKTTRHKRSKSKRLFNLKENYPAAAVSRSLDWKNLFGFIFQSPMFGILTAALYPLLAWLIHGEIIGQYHWTKLFKATVIRAIDNPLSTLTVVVMMAALMFFTDSHSKWQKYLGGFIHGLAHLAAIFVLGWLSFFLMLWIFGIDTVGYEAFRNNHPTRVNLVWFSCILLVCGIGGYFIGSLIMGVYLFISLHIFGRHDNEAFSALKIEDYKNFLRMHIDASGDLTIYPLKIDRVEREWDYQPNNGNGYYKPRNGVVPELIEQNPINVPGKPLADRGK
jgi:hypothetical protein